MAKDFNDAESTFFRTTLGRGVAMSFRVVLVVKQRLLICAGLAYNNMHTTFTHH